MSKDGLSRKEYFNLMLASQEEVFREITRLDDKEKKVFSDHLMHLELVHSDRDSYDTNIKGKSLENVVNFLLEHSSIFDIHKNIRSNTNETDQILILNSKGLRFRNEGFLDFKGNIFLSECKNYDKKIDVNLGWEILFIVANNDCFTFYGCRM